MEDDRSIPSFEQIYTDHAARILNLVYRLVGDEETAKDLTQEIFIKVYESLPTFRRESDIFTWIYRIAVNHASDHLKRRRRWLALMDREVSSLVREQPVPFTGRAEYGRPADEMLETRERAMIVWREILALPPKYSVPFVLHHYEGMSYNDIASTLGMSLAAVEARIHRAKKKLIGRLRPWLGRI